jgi:hypothetical protein
MHYKRVMSKPVKRRRGRPPKADEAMLEPITIRLTKMMVREIDRKREGRLDGADRSTMIRELIAKGLTSDD